MRFSVSLGWCGYLLDFSVGPNEDYEPEAATCSLDGGTTASTPVGFVRSVLPDWDDPGGYHTLDPGDDE